MKLVVNKSKIEEKWVEIDKDAEVKVKIRPFPLSRGIYLPGTPKEIAEQTWERFNYSVLDWEGIVDENEQPIPCNEETKKVIFDYCNDVVDAVALYIHKSNREIVDLKKT